jgi:glyoxylase-like metal-dependent hydrolase (beta-lactamase superfamily II)
MCEVDVLFEGHVGKKGEVGCSTCVLIKNGDKNIVVDPGTFQSNSVIVDALKKRGLSLEEITHVVLTHPHVDHSKNMGIFKNALIVDYWGTWTNQGLVEDFELGKGVKVVKTPGHTKDSISLVVSCSNGKIGIVGDLLWFFVNDKIPEKIEDLINYKDPYGDDIETQIKSRKKLFGKLNTIIPGHGPIINLK